ncbi:MAG: 6,7-dimethyl-8-ribityllumazine synthase [Candidatus Methanoliparum thermophilum]|uniref:6,7-dimethyl-8-ribityllumazine synthase n=1 Tax=Methanoliparum thermophilum TaxID=2491083 RepID=A0A520KSD7_METT2|nr:6,7-dimethyl-8-ribityllumazine synthase [Candidatus Methanoliparum sp. LAM-1]RZN64837.1 MAG: 6,7-dimethyl-8-ribityllumazine synthase [Candidatus Methanoliparum thermophilum]BDC36292.1 6,7-dimethyl-8-ribityllumazine synthase [Candidatus Methanoliparum sp. LAM-1]
MDVKLGFVVAEFNREITYQMEIVGKEHASFLGAKVEKIVYTPGVFDMPIMIKKLGRCEEIDAIVAIGAVIEGDTEHDEIVAQHAARKIMDLSLELDKPVTLGISGPGMTRLGAYERVDYAKRAVESAVKMVKRLKELD